VKIADNNNNSTPFISVLTENPQLAVAAELPIRSGVSCTTGQRTNF